MSKRGGVHLGTLLAISGVACALSVACGDDDSGGGAGTGGSAGTSGSGGVGGSIADSGSGGNSGGNSGGGSGGSAGTGGVPTDGGSCVRTPGPPDDPRYVAISHTHDANKNPVGRYELLSLNTSGSLDKTGTTFDMGRSTTGEIVFTPDGELGFVPTEDGKVGVFRIDPQGKVTVLHAAFSGAFYASKLAMSPHGDRVYVIDGEWRNVGGGIYALDIDCSDNVTDAGLIAPSKLPQGIAFVSGGRALLPAYDILASPLDQDLHLVDWKNPPTVMTSITAFSQEAAQVSSIAVTQDEKYVLMGDNSGFSSVPNRVAVVGLAGNVLTPLQTLTPLDDPADIETSPFDNTALVASGFGDALFFLSFDSTKPSAPFAAKELSYTGAGPQLPVDMVQIRRGALAGRVLIGEVTAVRQVQFEKSGAPSDLGPYDLGPGFENIIGSIGVQP